MTSRRQIFAQCPRSIPRSPITDLRTQAFDAQRSPKAQDTLGKGILDLLRESYSVPGGVGSASFAFKPMEPGQPYDKHLPQTQSLEMQPFLHELAPILKALDTFNLHSLLELKRAEERMESNGMVGAPLVNMTAKKRSAHDANLDKPYDRPPMKQSAISSSKDPERPFVKRTVSFAQTEEEIVSGKRREEKIKREHPSPILQISKLPAGLPNRPKGPIPPLIRDFGPRNIDYQPIPYTSNGPYPLENGNSRSNGESDTSGMTWSNGTNGTHESDPTLSSSPNGNIHPSRMGQIELSPARSRPIPRTSSLDPRLKGRR